MLPEGLIASRFYGSDLPSERRRDENHIWWQPTAQSPLVISNESKPLWNDRFIQPYSLTFSHIGRDSLRAQWQAGGVDSAVEPRRV